jgi:predicted MFS family arabinose efflux permease
MRGGLVIETLTHLVLAVKGMVVGSLLGGLVATRWGVTAPFWFAFVGSAIFLVLIWRQLVHVAHADEELDH